MKAPIKRKIQENRLANHQLSSSKFRNASYGRKSTSSKMEAIPSQKPFQVITLNFRKQKYKNTPMLTSFFGNSKPVHFLVLGGFLSPCFLWTVLLDSNGPQGSILIFSHIVVLVATVLSIIVLDFIVSKNQLTRRNSFTIFFYTCFLAMMSGVFLQPEMLWANFFLLLALRRIVS